MRGAIASYVRQASVPRYNSKKGGGRGGGGEDESEEGKILSKKTYVAIKDRLVKVFKKVRIQDAEKGEGKGREEDKYDGGEEDSASGRLALGGGGSGGVGGIDGGGSLPASANEAMIKMLNGVRARGTTFAQDTIFQQKQQHPQQPQQYPPQQPAQQQHQTHLQVEGKPTVTELEGVTNASAALKRDAWRKYSWVSSGFDEGDFESSTATAATTVADTATEATATTKRIVATVAPIVIAHDSFSLSDETDFEDEEENVEEGKDKTMTMASIAARMTGSHGARGGGSSGSVLKWRFVAKAAATIAKKEEKPEEKKDGQGKR